MNTEQNYPYKYEFVESQISAVRAVCMYLTQKYKQMIENFDRDLYIDWSENGLIIRAKDTETLNKAVENIKHDKKQIKIDILSDNIHKDDYQKFIETELKELHQQQKAFIHIVSYDKFELKSQQLQEKGFSNPYKQFQELKKQHPNFSLLMCTDRRFNDIQEILIQKLKPLMKQQQEVVPSQPPSTWDESANNSNDSNNEENQDNFENESQSNTHNHTQITKNMSSGNSITYSTNSSPTYNKDSKGVSNFNLISHQSGDQGSGSSSNSSHSSSNNLFNNGRDSKQDERSIPTSNNQKAFAQSGLGYSNSNKQNTLSNLKLKPGKFDVQIKQLLWLKSIDYLQLQSDKYKLIPLDQLPNSVNSGGKTAESNADQYTIEIGLNQEKVDSENSRKQLDLLEEVLINFNQQLDMKIIFQGKSAEIYQSLCCSRAFNRISSRYGNIGLFYFRMFEISMKDLENQQLTDLAKQYFQTKMSQKNNFCYLIAPKGLFEQIQKQIFEIERSLTLSCSNIQFDDAALQLDFSLRNFKADNYLMHFDQNEIKIDKNQQSALCSGTFKGSKVCVKSYEKVTEETAKKILKKVQLAKFYAGPKIVQVYGYLIKNENSSSEPKSISTIIVLSDLKTYNLGTSLDNDAFITPQQQIEIAKEIAAALNYMHTHSSRPSPHGNLKPENILISGEISQKVHLDDLISNQPLYQNNSYYNQINSSTDPSQKSIIATKEGDIWALGLIYLLIFFQISINSEQYIAKQNLLSDLRTSQPQNLGIINLIQEMLNPQENKRITSQSVVSRLHMILADL